MDVAGLEYGVFEFLLAFPVAWVLIERQLAPTQTARLRAALTPGSCPQPRTHAMTAWATTILEWHPPPDPVANALWDSYMDSAERVLET